MKTLLPALSLAFLLIGCTQKKEDKTTEVKTFPLKGEVVRIMPDEQRVMIAHEEIPNYMKAMTMPFKVKDTTLLATVHVGDSVVATLAVSRTESWLETISVLRKGEAPKVLSGEEILFKKMVKEGDPIPDPEFTNQESKKLHLSAYRGKVIALTFIYTRCPLPDFCIRMSDNFSRIQNSLKKNRSLDGKWHLFSITFDPDFDKPSILKQYGKTYGADFSDWDFLVTDKQSLEKIADAFDLTYQPDEGGLIAHTLRTVIVDSKGNVVRILKGNDWTPDQVAASISELTANNR
ncbi:MAG TPA: SCO family protein [Bacteroidota bacterium]